MKSKVLDIICLILKILIPLILIANFVFFIVGDIRISLGLSTYEASDIMNGITTIKSIDKDIKTSIAVSAVLSFMLALAGWLLMMIFKNYEKRTGSLRYFILMLIISFLNPLIISTVRLLLALILT